MKTDALRRLPGIDTGPRKATVHAPHAVPKRTWHGGPEARTSERFDRAVTPHMVFLRNYALSLARNAAEADDLVQETCLKALRSFHQFRPGTNARAWSARILRNTFLSRKRSQAAAPCVPLEEGAEPEELHRAGGGRDPHQALVSSRQQQAVERLLDRLSPRYRAAFRLLFEGHSYKEIATQLDVPIGTVMSRIHRARRAVAQSFQEADSVGA